MAREKDAPDDNSTPLREWRDMSTPTAQINRRVLIVDDSPAIHGDFCQDFSPVVPGDDGLGETENLLFGTPSAKQTQHFELDSAFQGREALDKIEAALAENRPYAMAFIDMRMPRVGMAWRPSNGCGKSIPSCKSHCARPIPTTPGKTLTVAWH